MRKSSICVSLVALSALAACEPAGHSAGVGFNDYSQNTAQALQGSPIEAGVISDEDVGTTGLSVAIEQGLERDPAFGGSTNSSTSNPLPRNTGAISDEQDFGAVSSRETIASDAQRLEANRLQYKEIEPTALPTRTSGAGGASIVSYALATTNAVGQPVYSRSQSSYSRYQTACSKFVSPDMAQEAFLEAGGPKSDRKGLDPDGDGFACAWDPAPFRAARGG
ncbi:hypothetical protein ACFE33_11530 [Falsihalocynthiibacter sp. SS001]|uniref:hypothetical protein n=1 Tax=Falsihalocynthiibacter sp. SS001 TaxID=3349698 RepID=UPI0036D35938